MSEAHSVNEDLNKQTVPEENESVKYAARNQGGGGGAHLISFVYDLFAL